ncbi:MAG: hypothetical protein KKA78_02485, partial [Alphaproteobacteria bacterium]|nr:hypothetical protein [Alphaproteobacteria bacterium]
MSGSVCAINLRHQDADDAQRQSPRLLGMIDGQCCKPRVRCVRVVSRLAKMFHQPFFFQKGFQIFPVLGFFEG